MMDDENKVHYLVEALEKILLCKGVYSSVPVTRCENVMKNTIGIVKKVLEKVKEK